MNYFENFRLRLNSQLKKYEEMATKTKNYAHDRRACTEMPDKDSNDAFDINELSDKDEEDNN